MRADPSFVGLDDGRLEVNAHELRVSGLYKVSLFLMLVGGLTSAVMLPDIYFGRLGIIVFLALFLLGVLIARLRTRYHNTARILLLVGPPACLTWALQTIDNPAVPYYATLAVLANAAVSPAAGLLAALVNTLPLVALVPFGDHLLLVVALMWLSAVLVWISSQGVYTVLDWAWSSQRRANDLLESLRDHQGELNRTVVALTEATRRLQRTGYELAVARLRAEEAKQVKERFAANISHEMRTPLNLILGFCEMMYYSPDVYGDMEWPPLLRRDVHQIYQSSRQLLDMVNDVLDLARADAGELPVQIGPGDLAAVVSEVADTARELVRGRDVDLILELPANLPRLAFDRIRIRQVLLNLLNNAARFTASGSITLSVCVEEHNVVVSVADTGIGIPPEELPRAFDEFHQVDMSLRRAQEGAGLGLAISKRFVEMHGGRIWVESTIGKGSTFTFALPLPSEQATMGRLTVGQAMLPSAQPEPSVILVERDPGVAETLRRHLKRYRVIPADDMSAAVRMVGEWHPQAVLVNVPPGERYEAMALETGRELLPPPVPLLFASLPSQTWLTYDGHVRACLLKPITREQLLTAVGEVDGAREVLIVDDDRGFVQLAARFLEGTRAGYHVRYAYDGREALEQMRLSRPDVVLLDLMMPDMTGLEVLDAMNLDEELGDIPVMIVTGNSYSEDALTLHRGFIGMVRGQGFSVNETLKGLRALLDLCQPDYASGPSNASGPDDSAEAPSPSEADARG
ncbi:MAG: ATP-binding protein [Anaerolineae bacterium]